MGNRVSEYYSSLTNPSKTSSRSYHKDMGRGNRGKPSLNRNQNYLAIASIAPVTVGQEQQLNDSLGRYLHKHPLDGYINLGYVEANTIDHWKEAFDSDIDLPRGSEKIPALAVEFKASKKDIRDNLDCRKGRESSYFALAMENVFYDSNLKKRDKQRIVLPENYSENDSYGDDPRTSIVAIEENQLTVSVKLVLSSADFLKEAEAEELL